MQTGYSGITALHKNLFYDGGMCLFYYTPIENIGVWPSIGFSQEYTSEPQLVAGKNWYGPIAIPNYSIGGSENQERDKRGIFYKIKIEGTQIGSSRENEVNLDNMAHYRYIVVGKVRAGGFFKMFGGIESPLFFDHGTEIGKGVNTINKTQISFVGEQLFRGIILPSFQNQNSIPSTGGSIGGGGNGGGNVITANQTETINFNNQSNIVIQWTTARKNSFGIFPLIQVWFNDGDRFSLANVPIWCDVAPPNTSIFTIDVTGISSGFIQIK